MKLREVPLTGLVSRKRSIITAVPSASHTGHRRVGTMPSPARYIHSWTGLVSAILLDLYSAKLFKQGFSFTNSTHSLSKLDAVAVLNNILYSACTGCVYCYFMDGAKQKCLQFIINCICCIDILLCSVTGSRAARHHQPLLSQHE